jgi:CDP-paratose 2-epimerase
MTATRERFFAERPVLITGGAGFIGCNIADALARRGQNVLVFDSFARHGAHENAHWLKSRSGDRVERTRHAERARSGPPT